MFAGFTPIHPCRNPLPPPPPPLSPLAPNMRHPKPPQVPPRSGTPPPAQPLPSHPHRTHILNSMRTACHAHILGAINRLGGATTSFLLKIVIEERLGWPVHLISNGGIEGAHSAQNLSDTSSVYRALASGEAHIYPEARLHSRPGMLSDPVWSGHGLICGALATVTPTVSLTLLLMRR
jgi:hypothetical protein